MKEKLEKLKVYIDLVLDFLAFKKAKDSLTSESTTTTSNTPNSQTTNIVSKIKNIFKK